MKNANAFYIMVNWQPLESTAQIDQLIEESRQRPCLIFKHSTRCSISFIAKHRLEGSWDIPAEELTPYYLDLVAHRNISNLVADHFHVRHESPQLLLIRDGRCIFDASHLDISVAEFKSCLESDTVG